MILIVKCVIRWVWLAHDLSGVCSSCDRFNVAYGLAADRELARLNEGMRRVRFEEFAGTREARRAWAGDCGRDAWDQRADIPGWRDRLRDEGAAGLDDHRMGPSGCRASTVEIARMLGLYRDRYAGFTVKHLHQQLVKRHDHVPGYTVTKVHLLLGLEENDVESLRAQTSDMRRS